PLSVLDVLRWPGVLRERQLDFAALEEPVKQALHEAAAALEQNRAREGERLAALLEERLDALVARLGAVRPLVARAAERYRQKLAQRSAGLDVPAQPERVEQELALVAARFDVSEAVDRLGGHVAEARAVVKRREPIGRRLE